MISMAAKCSEVCGCGQDSLPAGNENNIILDATFQFILHVNRENGKDGTSKIAIKSIHLSIDYDQHQSYCRFKYYTIFKKANLNKFLVFAEIKPMLKTEKKIPYH